MGDESEVPDPGHLGIFAALGAAFDPREVRQRTQAGRTFHYITARVAMNRLDDVVGPANWWDEYVPGENSVLCKLTILLPDGRSITKQDAGGYGGMPDQGDDDKAGYSDAFKRACVKFGLGRYLYNDGVPAFVTPAEPTSAHQPDPMPARPQPSRQAAPPRDGGRRQQEYNGRSAGQQRDYGDKAPTSGRAMFAWCKKKEEETGVGMLRYISKWATDQGFPDRMVEWNADHVAHAHDEAMRKLGKVAVVPAGPGDEGEDQDHDSIPF